MGFLDRMVADLVKSSTGFNVRPLVRMVGAKKLLALGGAAVAGAALTDRMQQSQGPPPTTPPTTTPPGPLPTSVPPGPLPTSAGPGPLPSAAVPPPPPPLPASAVAVPPPPPMVPASTPSAPVPVPPAPAGPDVGADSAGDDQGFSAALTLAGVRTVIAAALADGVLAEAERSVIDQHLASPELSAEQATQARLDLESPLAPKELASLVDDAAGGEVVYRLAAVVMLADNTVAPAERAWLDEFADALGFDAAIKSAIESSLVFGR